MTHSSDQWRTAAACRTEDPDLFFPGGTTGHWLVQAAEAKAICRACPVIETCLDWAMDSGQQAGIWGGTTETERDNLRRRRARAAARNRQAAAAAKTPACGTTKAYYQHLMAGEPIDEACQAASDGLEQQFTPPPLPPACGTRGGYQKHQREHTAICTPCRQANTDADRRLRNTGTTKAAA
ncbi:MAG: WhiB family transcriptional regulator [Pseudonocardia sp.]